LSTSQAIELPAQHDVDLAFANDIHQLVELRSFLLGTAFDVDELVRYAYLRSSLSCVFGSWSRVDTRAYMAALFIIEPLLEVLFRSVAHPSFVWMRRQFASRASHEQD
jgi:hypothetical protein